MDLRSDSIKNVNWKSVIRIAGAYVAWVMGSGFATGQEILQFFTSYGYYSFILLVINLVGFLLIGPMLLEAGQAHTGDPSYDHFIYFCGKKVGTVYSWFLPLSMFAGMVILISGAGATLQEYYGLNHYVGALVMAAMALTAYVIGFHRFIRIVSFIGPTIIVFSVFVGIVTVIRDFDGLLHLGQLMQGSTDFGSFATQNTVDAGTAAMHSAADASSAVMQSAVDAGSSVQSATDAGSLAMQNVADTGSSAMQNAAEAGRVAVGSASSADIDAAMEARQPVPWWWLSGLLYISYNLCGGSKYYSALGMTAASPREARLGGIIGTIALMASILLMNTAMLTDIGNTAVLDVPTLYLARKIAYILGAVFSVILIMGIFSSCSAMLWTISEKFVEQGTRRSILFAGCTCLCAFLLGLLPFAGLVGVVYTILGYIGLFFAGCVIYRRLKSQNH